MIEGLESMGLKELDLVMEEKAAKFAVCENNWPKVAPYAPDCNGSVARTRTHLAVMYHVRGLDVRATEMEDNGRSWEDSCCEFFFYPHSQQAGFPPPHSELTSYIMSVCFPVL